MKFISALISIIIISAILENFLPWWVIAPVAFIISYLFKLRVQQAFFVGFLSLFLLWGGMAFFIDRANEHILSSRISVLFIKSSKPLLIVLMTGFMAGLVGGFASLAGSLLVPNSSKSNGANSMKI